MVSSSQQLRGCKTLLEHKISNKISNKCGGCVLASMGAEGCEFIVGDGGSCRIVRSDSNPVRCAGSQTHKQESLVHADVVTNCNETLL